MVLASGLGHVLRPVSNLVLIRLTVPEMFGLMSIALIVGVIVSMLAAIGLQTVDLSKGGSQYKRCLIAGAAPLSGGQVCLLSVRGSVLGLLYKADGPDAKAGLAKLWRCH